MTSISLNDLDAGYGDAMRTLTSAMLGDAQQGAAVTRDTQLAAFAALRAGLVTIKPSELGDWLLAFAARSAARVRLDAARRPNS